MQKIGHEIKFDRLLTTGQQELTLLQRSPSQERVDSLRGKVKELESTIRQIQEALMGNSRLNRRDSEMRINGYKE